MLFTLKYLHLHTLIKPIVLSSLPFFGDFDNHVNIVLKMKLPSLVVWNTRMNETPGLFAFKVSKSLDRSSILFTLSMITKSYPEVFEKKITHKQVRMLNIGIFQLFFEALHRIFLLWLHREPFCDCEPNNLKNQYINAIYPF